MKKVSSNSIQSFFIFGHILMALSGIFLILNIAILISGNSDFNFFAAFTVVNIVMLLIGIFFRKLSADYVDEVFLSEKNILVIKGSTKTEIPFSEIENYSYLKAVRPQTIILYLKNESALGRKIIFHNVMSLIPLKTHPVVTELFNKID